MSTLHECWISWQDERAALRWSVFTLSLLNPRQMEAIFVGVGSDKDYTVSSHLSLSQELKQPPTHTRHEHRRLTFTCFYVPKRGIKTTWGKFVFWHTARSKQANLRLSTQQYTKWQMWQFVCLHLSPQHTDNWAICSLIPIGSMGRGCGVSLVGYCLLCVKHATARPSGAERPVCITCDDRHSGNDFFKLWSNPGLVLIIKPCGKLLPKHQIDMIQVLMM